MPSLSTGDVLLDENLRDGPTVPGRRQVRYTRHGHAERNNDVGLSVPGRSVRPQDSSARRVLGHVHRHRTANHRSNVRCEYLCCY